MSNEQRYELKYLRSQIRRLYKNKLPIDRVWKLFEAKCGHAAPNEWHKGAVFGNRGSKRGGDTEANRHRYLSYLYAVNPNPKDLFWVKFHIELEFGNQKDTSDRTRQQHQKQQHNKPSVDNFTKLTNWWDILEVQATDSKEIIKQAYRNLAQKYHPDSQNMPADEANEKMKLINFAYEQAKVNFK